MIKEMGKASEPDRNIFTGITRKMSDERGSVTMMINGDPADPFDSAAWPPEWERLSLTFEKSPLRINTENEEETTESLLHWGGRFTAAVVALAPLEPLEAPENLNPEGLPEGAKIRIEVNRYERSAFNRATCIEIHGYICKACGFDFSKVYGDLGKKFIHVHHVTPISRICEGYVIDPANDLVPLCPNCHAMVHRRSPPLAIEELKSLLA
jgi:5-methylcytosine-specific restriction protein A